MRKLFLIVAALAVAPVFAATDTNSISGTAAAEQSVKLVVEAYAEAVLPSSEIVMTIPAGSHSTTATATATYATNAAALLAVDGTSLVNGSKAFTYGATPGTGAVGNWTATLSDTTLDAGDAGSVDIDLTAAAVSDWWLAVAGDYTGTLYLTVTTP